MMSVTAAQLEYRHVDVFTDVPYTGNGLLVLFAQTTRLRTHTLISLTAEMRQFELIVVDAEAEGNRVSARIFTSQEELPFAGHPVIGAAAALHERHAPTEQSRSWVFVIAGREIAVQSERTERYYEAAMNQGFPMLGSPLADRSVTCFASALNLRGDELYPLPVQVISTGLPYLIVPVLQRGLERARIVVDDFEQRLARIGAKFVYVFDPDEREGRTWDNAGAVEDVATGSAAGPATAYLAAHGLAAHHEATIIKQGRFLGRPTKIAVAPRSGGQLWVGGPVAPVARGILG
jgi:PhzF family phenazine biosynthesis protein